MHNPIDRIPHTTAFDTPVMEHWLEREIAQWVNPMKNQSDDPLHHERTFLPQSYISLQNKPKAVTNLLVFVHVDALELAEPHEVGADEDAQLAALLLSALSVARMALVLHAHPQFVHLREVEQNEVDGVVHSARLALSRTIFKINMKTDTVGLKVNKCNNNNNNGLIPHDGRLSEI